MADDLRRHPLTHLALGPGIDRKREIGMGLDVDEAGGDREGARIDYLRGLAWKVFPHRADAAIVDCDVARSARRAGAVDEQAAADQQIVRHA